MWISIQMQPENHLATNKQISTWIDVIAVRLKIKFGESNNIGLDINYHNTTKIHRLVID